MTTQTTQATTKPTLRKLTLKKETLRRLTPAELRAAGGGVVVQRASTHRTDLCNVTDWCFR
jgi:hypothetical protein